MRFFTSDLHLGSNDTIKFDNRPFKNWRSFSRFIIRKYNKLAKPEDIIYVIGDFIDCHSQTDNSCVKNLLFVKKIKAKVVLILGNNEERVIKYFFDGDFNKFKTYCIECGFSDVKECDSIEICDREFFLTHKPKNHKEGVLNLFGHSHKAMGLYKSFGFNIGCDLNNYLPYSENDIVILLNKKEQYWDKDKNLQLV